MALLGNLGNYKNFGLLVIRVGLGVMFIYHGLPKLIGGEKDWAADRRLNKICRDTFLACSLGAAVRSY